MATWRFGLHRMQVRCKWCLIYKTSSFLSEIRWIILNLELLFLCRLFKLLSFFFPWSVSLSIHLVLTARSLFRPKENTIRLLCHFPLSSYQRRYPRSNYLTEYAACEPGIYSDKTSVGNYQSWPWANAAKRGIDH